MLGNNKMNNSLRFILEFVNIASATRRKFIIRR